MTFTDYIRQQTVGITTLFNPGYSSCNCRLNVDIVLADLVTPEIRSRKSDPEFPLGIDVIGRRLIDEGFTTDYSFLPPESVCRNMVMRNEYLMTFGWSGAANTPVKNARLLGINMMNYLQTPQFFMFLKLAGIPPLRMERTGDFPLVILGGHIWYNPLPLSDFYDILVAGDGEEVLCQIAQLVSSYGNNRKKLLKAVAGLQGTFVPGYTHDTVRPVRIDFAEERYSAGSSVVVNGTGAVILSRGCPFGCAFCCNRAVGGNYQVKPYSQVIRHIDLLSAAGVKRVLLCAAVGSLYRSEGRGYADVIHEIQLRGMSVRCMSDRPESLDSAVLEAIKNDKNRITIALECHPRIRRSVFCKSISENMVDRLVDRCIRTGIGKIHFYLIVAVPPVIPGNVVHLPGGFDGESYEDLVYCAEWGIRCAEKMRTAGVPRKSNDPYVILDSMPLIPAPGTALESVPFPRWERYLLSMHWLDELIPRKYRKMVRVTPAIDPLSHLLQALLERGAAVSGRAVFRACQMNGFSAPDYKEVLSAMAVDGIDEQSLFSAIPPDGLPYRGIIEQAFHRCEETPEGEYLDTGRGGGGTGETTG